MKEKEQYRRLVVLLIWLVGGGIMLAVLIRMCWMTQNILDTF